jgi:hypothetical protein
MQRCENPDDDACIWCDEYGVTPSTTKMKRSTRFVRIVGECTVCNQGMLNSWIDDETCRACVNEHTVNWDLLPDWAEEVQFTQFT